MERSSFDYGIDLGTTNSSVSVFEDGKAKTIDNNYGQKVTPSAVWIKRSKGTSQGLEYVTGDKAKDRGGQNSNVIFTFKRQMGKDYKYQLDDLGLSITPEELSAEILKDLRKDVQKRNGEVMQSAVITVPAIFDLAACNATKRAANLAGLTDSVLVMEPVAAAIAYGFQSEAERKYWFIYDLGGGTFDAAIVCLRDGVIQVVNNGGDLYLGGTDIDEYIVEQILIPALEQEYDIEIKSGGLGYLKREAEKAKIQLSQDLSADIFLDSQILKDMNGNVIEYEYTLKRSEIEPFIDQIVKRTIDITKNVMNEKKLNPHDFEKVILVGGPTLTPRLREVLAAELKIPLEYDLDPLTVVAQGASIFAGSQIIKAESRKPLKAGQFDIELDYEPVGNEVEPSIGGRLKSFGNIDVNGYSVEFVDTKTDWRSGRVQLSAKGTFITTLKAVEGRLNEYRIELRDDGGLICTVRPDKVTYMLGASVEGVALINSVGVAMANGELDVFMEKGTKLPFRRCKTHRTVAELKKGQTGSVINIPIMEGENILRADRNLEIGQLEIRPEHVVRDLPKGSKVEITIEIDKERMVKTMAYVPVLDEEFHGVHNLLKKSISREFLVSETEKEKERLDAITDQVSETKDQNGRAFLKQIDANESFSEIEENIKAADGDEDSADRALNRLLELKTKLDQVEDRLEWPSLLNGFKEAKNFADSIISDFGSSSDKQKYKYELLAKAKDAYDAEDPILLKLSIKHIQDFAYSIWIEQPQFWVGYFNYLLEHQASMSDLKTANRLILQGKKAINDNDLEGVQSAVRQLMALLPEKEREAATKQLGSTISDEGG